MILIGEGSLEDPSERSLYKLTKSVLIHADAIMEVASSVLFVRFSAKSLVAVSANPNNIYNMLLVAFEFLNHKGNTFLQQALRSRW